MHESPFPPKHDSDRQPVAAKVLVWDIPVRVFHWLLALSFAGAYITAESERWLLVHMTLGYTVAGLVSFRILWGLIGSRHARFSNFVRGPAAVLRYLKSMLRGQPEHYTGHNPAGALAILAMLILPFVIALTGWATYNEITGEWTEEVHELTANLMLAVVGIHIAGILLGSWLHRENLPRSMFTGRKTGSPREATSRAWPSVGLLLLVAVLGYWWLEWQGSAADAGAAGKPAISARTRAQDDDD